DPNLNDTLISKSVNLRHVRFDTREELDDVLCYRSFLRKHAMQDHRRLAVIVLGSHPRRDLVTLVLHFRVWVAHCDGNSCAAKRLARARNCSCYSSIHPHMPSASKILPMESPRRPF